MVLVVREAIPDDAEAIARVHVGTWQSAYRGQIPDEYLDGLSVRERGEVWRRILATSGRDEVNWVAERDGAIVGFAGAGTSRDSDGRERTGELFAIYVLADHWGAGVGGALMEKAIGWLRAGYRSATLWVLATNERAQRFYRRWGWTADGATKEDDRGSFVLHEVRYRIDF